MSAKHYFPDSFSCRCSQILPIRNTASAPTRAPLVAAVVVLVVLVVSMMMMVMMILGKEEGAVMQEGGVPPLSLPQSRLYRFAYNSALQNDL